jgi:hypothetical protein
MNFIFFILILINGILYCVQVDKHGNPLPGAEPQFMETTTPAHKTNLREAPWA